MEDNSTNSQVFSNIKLKVPEREKYKNNKQWFKDMSNRFMPFWNRAATDEYEEMMDTYALVNNDLSRFQDNLKLQCNPFFELGAVEQDLLPYNQIPQKLMVLKGEMLKRGNSMQLILLSSDAIKKKDDMMLEAIKASVDERVRAKIMSMKAQMEGKSPEEIDAITQEIVQSEEPEDLAVTDFKSKNEIFYSRLLKHTFFEQDVMTKKLGTFEDTLTVDRCFVYCGWKNGKPHIKVCNPINIGFHKAPDELFIQKGDFVWYRESVTYQDVMTEYGNILTTEQIDMLGIHSYNANRWDSANDVMAGTAETMFDHTRQNMILNTHQNSGAVLEASGMHQGGELNGDVMRLNKLWKVHMEFKAYKEIGFLSYKDEYGNPTTTIVDSNYSKSVPKEAKKVIFTNRFGDDSAKWVWLGVDEIVYELELMYIPRRYEVTRIGEGVYVNMREVPFQPLHIDNPFTNFELSYKGAIFTSRNAKSISPVKRAIPSQFTYFFVSHLMNREIAKYEGSIQNVDTDQIPDDLGRDKHGEQIIGIDAVTAHAIIQRRSSYNYYSGSQSSLGGLPPSTRSPGSSSFVKGSIQEIMGLQNLKNLINVEIGMAMGISPQREAMYSANSNVADNQSAMQQSYHATEVYFYLHNLVWKHAINEHLYNMRSHIEDIFINNPYTTEHYLQYLLPDGSIEMLRVTPEDIKHTDIGLYLTNEGQVQRYHDIMMQQLTAIANNAAEGVETISSIIKSIVSGASPEETHRNIEIAALKQHQRQQAMQEQQAAQQQEIAKMQQDTMLQQQKMQESIISLKAIEDRITKLQVESMKQEGLERDRNNDGIPDRDAEARNLIDQAKVALDSQKHQDDVRLKQRELDIKDKEVQARAKEKKTSK
jgi:hypothetical protein